MPFTLRRSSRDQKGLLFIISCAVAGPTPVSFSNSFAVAVFKSIFRGARVIDSCEEFCVCVGVVMGAVFCVVSCCGGGVGVVF